MAPQKRPKRPANVLDADEDENQPAQAHLHPRDSQNVRNKKKRGEVAHLQDIRNSRSSTELARLKRLEQQARHLQEKIAHERAASSDNNISNEEHDDDDFESEDDIHFVPTSAITPMETVVPTTAIPPVNLRHISRKQAALTTPKTPRNAFMSLPSPLEHLDLDRQDEIGSSPSSALHSIPSISSTVTVSSIPALVLTTHLSPEPPKLLTFALDYRPGGKIKADDYDSEGKAIILRADAYYEAKIIGVQAFPEIGTKIAWAKKAFQDACHVAEKQYQIEKKVEQLIYSRGSRIRGDILRHVEEAVTTVFGFSKDTSKKTQACNLELYNTLKKKMAFAFKDTVRLNGFAENPVFQLILRLVCFGQGTSSRGVVFARFFDPVSLGTLALFMTQITHVMRQWSSGIFERHGPKDAFTEAANSKVYSEYLQELRNWEGLNTAVVLNIRKRMYSRARAKAGIDPPVIKSVIIGDIKTRMISELAGRTGETDTEDEEWEGNVNSTDNGDGSGQIQTDYNEGAGHDDTSDPDVDV